MGHYVCWPIVAHNVHRLIISGPILWGPLGSAKCLKANCVRPIVSKLVSVGQLCHCAYLAHYVHRPHFQHMLLQCCYIFHCYCYDSPQVSARKIGGSQHFINTTFMYKYNAITTRTIDNVCAMFDGQQMKIKDNILAKILFVNNLSVSK